MTNRSFLFDCNSTKHIMRIPGEGTDQLINRREEAQVYQSSKTKVFVTILNISIQKMATNLPVFSKMPVYVTRIIRMTSPNA